MVSVVIAAHNEQGVLGATLDAVLSAPTDPLEVIVVVSGSTDESAAVARAHSGVTVLELEQGSKPLALNAGDRTANSFPRIYLDADIVVPSGGIAALEKALSAGAMAAVPGRRLNVQGRPWPVRAYFLINERLPVFQDGLFGRGMIALSAEGRARFGDFPLMVADDLFLDSLFASREKAHLRQIQVVVETPQTTRELIRRLIRVRRGNAAMRRAAGSAAVPTDVRRSDRWAWLRVIQDEPRLAPAGVVYVLISLIAAAGARKGPMSAMAWGRDGSTRR